MMKKNLLFILLLISLTCFSQNKNEYIDNEFKFKINSEENLKYTKSVDGSSTIYSFFDEGLIILVKKLDNNPYNLDATLNSFTDRNKDYLYERNEISEKELIVKVTDKNKNIIRVQKIINSDNYSFILIANEPIFYKVALDYFKTFSFMDNKKNSINVKTVGFYNDDLTKYYSALVINDLKPFIKNDLDLKVGNHIVSNNIYYYDFETANKICPKDYRLPTEEELTKIFSFVKINEIILSKDYLNVKYNGAIGNDNSKMYFGEKAFYWTKEMSENNTAKAFVINLENNKTTWGFMKVEKDVKLCVRCIKN